LLFLVSMKKYRGVSKVSKQVSKSFQEDFTDLQHVSRCLIYAAAYLFQFSRHMALLLKSSSALPAHHCMRTTTLSTRLVVGLAGCLALSSLTTEGVRWYSEALIIRKLVQNPATLYALNCSPTSCQVLLQSFKRLTRRSSQDFDADLRRNTVVVRGRKNPRYSS
jgi:hypothetical protein